MQNGLFSKVCVTSFLCNILQATSFRFSTNDCTDLAQIMRLSSVSGYSQSCWKKLQTTAVVRGNRGGLGVRGWAARHTMAARSESERRQWRRGRRRPPAWRRQILPISRIHVAAAVTSAVSSWIEVGDIMKWVQAQSKILLDLYTFRASF